ncbi:hypothetical protein [Nannocystis pusilla]|uniref:hypothetical protein n=1 Tax=Nannocystis pusilla TaxID=889268 RepID=UPI003B77CF3E
MADDTVRCWGNVPGWVELPGHREPEPVPGLDGVVSVRAGWSHVCALGKDGRVRCWGKNHTLQVVPSESPSFVAKVPTVVAGVEDAVELAVADHFGAARLGDGTLRVWGGEAPADVSPGRVSRWRSSARRSRSRAPVSALMSVQSRSAARWSASATTVTVNSASRPANATPRRRW